MTQKSKAPGGAAGRGNDAGAVEQIHYTLENATTQLLAHLGRGGTWGYYWVASEAKDAKGDALEKHTFWWPAGKPGPIPSPTGEHGPRHIYLGVHTSSQNRGPGRRALIETIESVNCLFAEFDAKDFDGGKTEAHAHVDSLAPAPSVVIDSAGGYHLYWLLAEPFALTTDSKRQRAREIQARWVAWVGSDGGAKDLARVLRVPGTKNCKGKYGPDFPTATILRADFSRLYDLDVLEALLPEKAQAAPRDNGRSGLKTFTHADDIASAAKHLERLAQWRCDDYGAWVGVGMALSELGATGLAMWEDWSQGSAKFKAGECAGKWDTFSPGVKGIDTTLASLSRWANEDSSQSTTGQRQETSPAESSAETPATAEHATRDADGALRWVSKKTPATVNYIAALNSLGYHFRMNVCNDRVEINDEPISDALRAKIRSQMRDLGYRHVNVMEDAWTGHAYDRRFHPVRDFLGDLTWDGADHIEALASFFTDTNDYLSTFLRRWLVGAVARAYEPRSCQNRMLVLDGEQGVGKSYFVRWLASPLTRPELFVEGPVNPDDKDNLLRLITAWLWEVSEVGSTTRRSDREALKYFLSMQQVTVRKPYGREDLIKPALASFVGTVNDVGGFLDDPTGYRRFMAVHLNAIDWGYSDAVDPAQVWAQAKALYDRGEPWELDAQEAECAAFANAQYEVADPLEDILLRHYVLTGDGGDFTATVDIRDTLNGHGWRLGTPRAEAMAISGVLKRLGLKGTRRAVHGNQERGFSGVKENTGTVNL